MDCFVLNLESTPPNICIYIFFFSKIILTLEVIAHFLFDSKTDYSGTRQLHSKLIQFLSLIAHAC